ncbi:MerR family transcriptional regulator [Fusobacterium necrophorum subsp. funduliforme]|uniref:Cupin domain protein n=6 Tax=Fusobacterium necrophorum TaxID=859 RepID=A0AAN3VUB6_9FUSO|nr:XRE family transcriptional regulator [Fusobacterium necrophorum]AVQ21074.1 XRE family transcriptional regulator [Fusobacterium necrophorum subsp. funduliforme]AYV92780.1 XRE family transcriptional regulator [Fusobacterium necrophorum subsp. funduliforme]AYV94855.1 XRE family transcriptional regulator [Fusobacterium necrophorum subsp. funduliforme]AYZ72953.1 XRE family transcriptional regulator [Fusobacterium necrophorum]AZW09049.1 XRE family transcriptional regulator [Fusobacterium necropho
MSIGEKIKKSRNEKSLSLRELAVKVDLSASFLSQIEQGKASPSIENLKKIATALDVRVSYLIEDDEVQKNVDFVKKENIKYIESRDSNTKMALLTVSHAEKTMEPILYEIGPGGESGRNSYSHSGEEFIYITQGELEVYINDTVYKLKEGDSLYFKSNQQHRFKNSSKKETKAIWVVSPPGF